MYEEKYRNATLNQPCSKCGAPGTQMRYVATNVGGDSREFRCRRCGHGNIVVQMKPAIIAGRGGHPGPK